MMCRSWRLCSIPSSSRDPARPSGGTNICVPTRATPGHLRWRYPSTGGAAVCPRRWRHFVRPPHAASAAWQPRRRQRAWRQSPPSTPAGLPPGCSTTRGPGRIPQTAVARSCCTSCALRAAPVHEPAVVSAETRCRPTGLANGRWWRALMPDRVTSPQSCSVS